MALTPGQLLKARDDLWAARASGTLSYRDQNGEEITYKSDRQMAAALAALDRQIAELAGRRAPNVIYFRTSKGL